MAELKEGKDTNNTGKLKSLYSSPPSSGLNTALRNELEAFAVSNKSRFAVSIFLSFLSFALIDDVSTSSKTMWGTST